MRTLKCPCKARKCDECKGCVKCQCHCHGPPPRLPAEKRPTKVKKPPKVKTPRTSNGDDPTPKRRQLTMDELMQPRRRSSSGEKKAAEDAVDTLEDAADDADDVQPRRSSRSQSVVDQGDEPDTPAVATDETAAVDDGDANVVDDNGESTAVEPVPEEPVVVPDPMSLEDQLQALMDRRETEVSELAALERQIFELEGAYLRRNQHAGNIAKGWAPAKTFIAEVMKDQLLELELSGENPPDMTRSEEDAVSQQRIFSFSSTSSPAELLAQQWVEHKSSDELLALRLASAPVSRALRKRELTVDTTESIPSPRMLDEGSSSSAKPRSKSKRKR